MDGRVDMTNLKKMNNMKKWIIIIFFIMATVAVIVRFSSIF